MRTDDSHDSEGATYVLMASSEDSASSGPDDGATNRPATPSTTHRRRVRPGWSAGRPAAAGMSTALSRLLLKCNASEIYGELSKRQLRTAGLRLQGAVDVLAASQPMATERQAAYMESIVLSRGRRAGEQTPCVWMRHLLTTAAVSQWINGWT